MCRLLVIVVLSAVGLNSAIAQTIYAGRVLEGLDFRNTRLLKAVFNGAILDNCVFDRTSFSGGVFSDVRFVGVDLRGLTLERCSRQLALERCALQEAVIESSQLYDLRLRNCYISSLRLERANISGSSGSLVEGCSWSGTRFARDELNRCSFEQCELTGTRFYRSDFASARFEYCDFRGARLDGCNLSGMTIDGVRVEDAIKFYKRNR
ncbi:MAG: pentapeptide repeat-containing protein [Armatimonadota bacterium]